MRRWRATSASGSPESFAQKICPAEKTGSHRSTHYAGSTMPGLYKDEGIVLKTIKLGEADRIVTIFTRYNGKVRAVAKGVRKTKSRFGGRLEPFTRVQLMIYRGRNLDTITGADILDPFKPARASYERLAAAAALTEMVEKITPDRERSFDVYALLLAGMSSLGTREIDTLVPAFCVKLLSLSGYHPQLHTCAGCGARSVSGFSPVMGGAVCETCWHEDPDALRISTDGLVLLERLLAKEFGVPAGRDESEELTQALKRYAEYHLERPLRSLDPSALR
jgi:DNA repair protein RecO (recombination protein O)